MRKDIRIACLMSMRVEALPGSRRDGSGEKLVNDLREFLRTRPHSQMSIVEDIELRMWDQAMHDLRVNYWNKRVVISCVSALTLETLHEKCDREDITRGHLPHQRLIELLHEWKQV